MTLSDAVTIADHYPHIQPLLPFDKLQGLRLAHAIAEAGYTIVVPSQLSSSFSILNREFPLTFSCNFPVASQLQNILIDHEKPWTSIGEVGRPLIFPHSIVNHCRQLWNDNRPVFCSFAGLITQVRRTEIFALLKPFLSWYHFLPFPHDSLSIRIMKKIYMLLYGDEPEINTKKRYGTTVIWSTNRGRRLPHKIWDPDYLSLTANSQFVLCPAGECRWSYRFFEAILCGAIPIVNDIVAAYEGFKFYNFDDQLANLRWSKEDASNNFSLCRERLTVPPNVLKEEICRNLL